MYKTDFPINENNFHYRIGGLQHDAHSRQRPRNKTIYFVFVIFIIECGLCAALIWQIKQNKNDNPQEFCVPCGQLAQGPLLEDNVQMLQLKTSSSDLKTADCCAETPKQVAIVFDMIYQRKEKIDRTKGKRQRDQQDDLKHNSTHNKRHRHNIRAHVLIGRQPSMTRRALEYDYVIRNWLLEERKAHVHGVKLFNGRFSIAKSGYYCVYSQMYFVLEDFTKEQEGNTKVLIHSIKRYNAIYPNDGIQILAKNKGTKCWTDKGIVDHTSVISSTFLLHSGDEVFVTVSDIAVVSMDPDTSFFGLYAI